MFDSVQQISLLNTGTNVILQRFFPHGSKFLWGGFFAMSLVSRAKIIKQHYSSNAFIRMYHSSYLFHVHHLDWIAVFFKFSEVVNTDLAKLGPAVDHLGNLLERIAASMLQMFCEGGLRHQRDYFWITYL